MKMDLIKKKKKKGFTLIELIVVIAIIGILAAIAIPKLTGFQNTAKISADKATFDMMTKNISIAVANGDVDSDITLATTAGVATFTGTDAAAITAMFESSPTFRLSGNSALTAIKWTITSAGAITPPKCATTGLVTN